MSHSEPVPFFNGLLLQSLRPHLLEDPANDLVGVDSFGPCMKIEYQPVPQHGNRHGADVVEINMVSS